MNKFIIDENTEMLSPCLCADCLGKTAKLIEEVARLKEYFSIGVVCTLVDKIRRKYFKEKVNSIHVACGTKDEEIEFTSKDLEMLSTLAVFAVCFVGSLDKYFLALMGNTEKENKNFQNN